MYISAGSLQYNRAAVPDQTLCDRGDGARLFRVQSEQCGDAVRIGEHADRLARERHFDGCGNAVRETVDPADLVNDRDLSVDAVLNENGLIRLKDDPDDVQLFMLVDDSGYLLIAVIRRCCQDIGGALYGPGNILDQQRFPDGLSCTCGSGRIVADHGRVGDHSLRQRLHSGVADDRRGLVEADQVDIGRIAPDFAHGHAERVLYGIDVFDGALRAGGGAGRT